MGRVLYRPAESTQAAAAAAAANPVGVIGAEDFAVGDLVFLDTKQFTFQKMVGMPATMAMTAGPTGQSFPTPMSGSISDCAGSFWLLPDNSFIVAAIGHSGSNYQLDISKYTARGVLLQRFTIAAASTTVLAYLSLCVGTTGMVMVSWQASGNGNYMLLTPSFQPVLTGTGGTSVHALQETNNGGFIIAHTAGFTYCSAAGVTSLITAASLVTSTCPLAKQSQLDDDGAFASNPRSWLPYNAAPLVVSGGGFLFAYIEGNASTSMSAVIINADGTLRSGPTPLGSYAGQAAYMCHVARDPVTGNICWGYSLNSTNGGYGIVSDALAPVKAASSIAVVVGTISDFSIIAGKDPGGAFTIFGWNAGGSGQITALYMSAAGVIKAGFPKNLGTGSYGNDTKFLKAWALSTGTFVVWSGPSAPYLPKYSWTDLAGNTTTGTLFDLKANANAMISAGVVYNDTIYGAISAAAGNCDLAAFTVPNTGIPDALPIYNGSSTPDVTKGMRAMMDPNNAAFNIITSAGATTLKLDKSYVQHYGALSNPQGKYRRMGFGWAFWDGTLNGANGPGAGGSPGAYFVKPKSTLLYGVAGSASLANAALSINTKGLFSTTFTGYAGNFDHSSNNPPGAKGWINSGTIQLVGY